MWKPGQHVSRRALSGVIALLLVFGGPIGALAQGDDQSATPSGVDPCQLVTSAEASALAGATYTSGTETTYESGSYGCVYGAQTLNVFMVLVAQAPDPDTAQAAWSDYESKAQALMQRSAPPGLTLDMSLNDVTDLAGADRAAVAQGSASIAGRSISASSFYLLKGTTFVTFNDLVVGQPAPTADALEAQAQTVVTRLP